MVGTLDHQLRKVQEQESEILEKIDERNGKRRIKCNGCDSSHQIKNLVLIQTHYYIEPHGCTGGDYSREGGLQYVCPKTEIKNRLLFNNDDVPYEERKAGGNDPEAQFKSMYKSLFREVIDDHDERTSGEWVNNFYVDKHRKMFGLVGKRKSKEDQE